MSTDLKSIAAEALAVQDAVNPRGVLASWHRALCMVWGDPDARNAINVLYMSKMASLLMADTDALGGCSLGPPMPNLQRRLYDFSWAYEWAKRVSK